MKYFTHYWQNDTWEHIRIKNNEGRLLEHLSGNQFNQRGIERGDIGYVLTVKKGKLYLCGKLIVGKYCDVTEASRVTGLKPEELWQADEHIIASRATVMLWDLKVPLPITKKLRFISGKEIIGLTFTAPDELDRQTLRGVRFFTPESAVLLDNLLGKLKPVELFDDKEIKLWKNDASIAEPQDEFESGVEGSKKQRFVTYYERKPENRKRAVEIHGHDCAGCTINFEKTYGSHGKDFIHVHHLEPVSEFEKPKKINPRTDLTVLCPNCHAMVHRRRDKTLSIEELKKLIADCKKKP